MVIRTEVKGIDWIHVEGKPISRWYGKVNGRVLFEINHFKNGRFDDPKLMTSSIVPMGMQVDRDLEELKETAYIMLEAFINSFLEE